MKVDFVAIFYQWMNELEVSSFRALERMKTYYEVRIEFFEDTEGKTYWMIKSIVPDPENGPILVSIIATPDRRVGQ